mmetsp:Transcript_9337/g.14080  ORF Transcript_9337/g.14080 Transcript_9337/m.14080 type:complete len:86 (-) Transcript_9337:209-466(-)
MYFVAFRDFMERTCDVDGDAPDEVFSCAINAFADDDEDLPDKVMTKSEFVTGVVRVANLWVLMNEGMANSSNLTYQTSIFLKSLK